MKEQPLTSNEHGKILIFSLLLAPSVIFLVGVIPALFLSFGVFMMKKNKDFASIDTAVQNFKWYTWITFVVFLSMGFYFLYEEHNHYLEVRDVFTWVKPDYEQGLAFLALAAIPVVYRFLVVTLFYEPLRNHQDWVVENGIFSNFQKGVTKPTHDSGVEIIRAEKLKQYSVADELIKWARLKEDGHISEQQFNEAKEKLLKGG